MSAQNVYILGGYQTDFARNWTREAKELSALCRETVQKALQTTYLDPQEIEVAHLGNFAAELFCHQGHLGAFFVEADPLFAGLPTSRHEAACASGSIAILAAMADILAGHYAIACVLRVELMRNIPAFEAQKKLGAAAWVPQETDSVEYPWPKLFNHLGEEYESRYGLKLSYLAQIARQNFANARRNPNAQTRHWKFEERSFQPDDQANPILTGQIHKQDCSQVTDGGCAIFLASREFAQVYSKTRDIPFETLPYIKGWGHTTDRMIMVDKLVRTRNEEYILPHVRKAINQAFERAKFSGVESIDMIETHDCFTITQYMAIDHFGLTAPGQSWQAIEDGITSFEGAKPINPSGGLIGVGHPVGSSGVRMVLDAAKQIRGLAGDYQVADTKNVATLNIGGSATTTVCFIVGVD